MPTTCTFIMQQAHEVTSLGSETENPKQSIHLLSLFFLLQFFRSIGYYFGAFLLSVGDFFPASPPW